MHSYYVGQNSELMSFLLNSQKSLGGGTGFSLPQGLILPCLVWENTHGGGPGGPRRVVAYVAILAPIMVGLCRR